MIEIGKKEDCNGCHACTNICPKNCISMIVDNEGFWYPKVNEELCVECNLCNKVCPIINTPKRNNNTLAYACKSKDEVVRSESSSGGIFTLLCEYVINNNGVVFGAAYNEEFNVSHCYVETIEECAKFRGSKYVQSIIGDTYRTAKEFLNKGRVVLFSGTPCQISGLRSYLMKDYENLYLIDIACHGVPSPNVYRKYINKISKLNSTKIINIQFREKSNGWKDYNFKVTFEDGEFKNKRVENKYMKGFLSDLFLRPSCYECKFKKPITSADITLADYWGVENIHKEFDDDKGISLVLVNTNKGAKLLNNISNNMKIIETNYDYAIKCNPSIVKPVDKNIKRDKFFSKIDKNDIEKNIDKYTKVGFTYRAIRRIKGCIKKIKINSI